MGVYQAFARWAGDKTWFRPVATGLVPKLDAALLQSGGRYISPFPTLLLTTVGHRSGRPHRAPLYYLQDDGYVVIASNYGRREPDWSRNLAVDPFCTITVRRMSLAARALLVPDDLRPGYIERFAGFYPSYRDYVARAGREIPVWNLTPITA